MSARILLTGFTPFAGESLNSSFEVIKSIPNMIGQNEVIIEKIPTIFDQCFESAQRAIDKYLPDFVINVGQMSHRSAILIERVAINMDDASIPDNIGQCPQDKTIVDSGQPAYFSTLPIKKLISGMTNLGLPCEISNSAGTYVCNHLMYRVLHYIHVSGLPIKAGFVHVPLLTEQIKGSDDMRANLPLTKMTLALEQLIKLL